MSLAPFVFQLIDRLVFLWQLPKVLEAGHMLSMEHKLRYQNTHSQERPSLRRHQLMRWDWHSKIDLGPIQRAMLKHNHTWKISWFSVTKWSILTIFCFNSVVNDSSVLTVNISGFKSLGLEIEKNALYQKPCLHHFVAIVTPISIYLTFLKSWFNL